MPAPAVVGSEITVSPSGPNVYGPSVAATQQGGYMVAWQGFGSAAVDPDGGGVIFYRVYDAAGQTAQGAPLVAISTLTGGAVDAIAHATTGGGFAIAWVGTNPNGANSGQVTRIQFFAADGSKIGTESTVSLTGSTEGPRTVASDLVQLGGKTGLIVQDNNQSSQSSLLLYDSATGARTADPVIALGSGVQDVVSLAGGGIGVVRGARVGNTATLVLDVRTATGALASTLPIPSDRTGISVEAELLTDGRVVVAEHSSNTNTIRLTVIAANGSAIVGSATLPLANGEVFTGDKIDVVPHVDGGFSVIFDSRTTGNPDNFDVQGQRYTSSLGLDGGRYLLNTVNASGTQNRSAAEELSDGNFIVAWEDYRAGNFAGNAIYAREFSTVPQLDGNDNLIGTAGNDTIDAKQGNDTVKGLGGADALIGGLGDDILIGDGPVSLTAAAASVRRLYIATLDRAPDDGGWIDWATQREAGQSLETIAAGFVGSTEFQAKYGALDNTQFVTQLYRNVLDREPDAPGLANAVNALNSGALSRTQIVTGFSESAEFVSGTSTTLHAGQVYRLYGATLARAPDAGGFETWTDGLGSGRALVDIAAGFVNSSEFQQRYGALDNPGFVTLLYQNVLGRAPDSGGLAFWQGQLDGGTQTRTQVVTGFSESAEYINGTRVNVDAFMRNVMTAWSDTLTGGSGDDKLTGGRGSDRFVFLGSETGADTVYGFDSYDTLQLTGFGFATPAQALAVITQQGANAVLAFNGTSITFADTQVSVLQGLPAQGWVLG